MATSLSNLLALLALDNSAYLEGLTSSKAASDSFADKLSNVGGAVVLGGLTVAATAVTAVGAAAWDAGNQFDEAMDTIAVATGATGPELDALREDFENVFTSVPTDAKTAADAISILNSRLDVTGPALQNIAKPMLEATRIMGGDLTANAEAFTRVIGDWNIPVENSSESLDKLFVAAQQAGVPLDQLMQRIVQYGSPMRNFGFDFDQATALLAAFEAQGVNTEIVMSGLRSAQGKFIKDGKDMKTGLWETIEAIQNAESATDGLAIATEVFGSKAAGDMFDTIRSGKFEIADLVNAMQNAQGAILETADSTSDWAEKWQTFRNKITTALAPVGEAMMDGLGKAMDSVAEIFERPEVQEGLTKFTEMIGTFITKIVEYIPPLIDGFFRFVEFLKNNQGIVVAVLTALGAAALVWGYTTAAAAITAITPLLPVIAVILLIAAVVYVLYEAWTKNWGGIQDKTQAVMDFIQDAIQSGMQFIEDLTSGKLGIVSELWQNTTQAIQIWWKTFTDNIRLILQAFSAAFHGDWYRFGELLRQAWDNAWKAIGNILRLAWSNLKTIVSSLVTNITNFFRNTDWGQVGRNIVQGIANGIRNSLSWIIDAARSAARAALNAAKGFLGIKSPSQVFEMQVGWQMAAGVAAGWENGLDRMLSFRGLEAKPAEIPIRDVRATAGGQATINGGGNDELTRMLRELARAINEKMDSRTLSRALVEAMAQRGVGG